MKKIISIILLVLWMCLIFYFSNQPSYDSDKASNGVIDKLINIVEKVSNYEFNEEELNIINKNLVFPVRKSAHFTIYLILGILFYNLIRLYMNNNFKILIISILMCVIYACSDEIHQLFVFGRSGEIRDVLIDSIGSLIGILIIYTFYKRKNGIYERENNKTFKFNS